MPTKPSEAERWADQLERSFHGGAWHGLALEEAIVGIDASTAAACPEAAAHSILELVHHIAYWLETAQARLNGRDAGGGTEDWSPPAAGEAGWQAARARLRAAHHALHASVRELDAAAFDEPVPGSDPTLRGMLFGVLQHNAYHAGQIVALSRLLGRRPA